jgi:hypothetical protein
MLTPLTPRIKTDVDSFDVKDKTDVHSFGVKDMNGNVFLLTFRIRS